MFPVDLIDLEIDLIRLEGVQGFNIYVFPCWLKLSFHKWFWCWNFQSFRNDTHLLEMELLHYEIDCPTQPFERMDHDQVSNYSNSVSQLVSLLRSGRASWFHTSQPVSHQKQHLCRSIIRFTSDFMTGCKHLRSVSPSLKPFAGFCTAWFRCPFAGVTAVHKSRVEQWTSPCRLGYGIILPSYMRIIK